MAICCRFESASCARSALSSDSIPAPRLFAGFIAIWGVLRRWSAEYRRPPKYPRVAARTTREAHRTYAKTGTERGRTIATVGFGRSIALEAESADCLLRASSAKRRDSRIVPY